MSTDRWPAAVAFVLHTTKKSGVSTFFLFAWMRALVVSAALLMLVCSCAASAANLKKPIQDRCDTAGLVSCAQLAKGFVEYLDGARGAGKKRATKALGKNSAEKADEFLLSMRGIADRSAAKPHLPRIRGLVGHLQQWNRQRQPISSKKQPSSWGRPARVAHRPAKPKSAPVTTSRAAPKAKKTGENEPVVVVTPDTDLSRLVGGMVAPSNDPRVTPCGSLYPSGGQCVLVGQGPLVVTDLIGKPNCGLFVAVGDPEGDPGAPTWIMHAPLNMHGARLKVDEDKGLFVGMTRPDPQCSLSWGGFIPHGSGSTTRL